MRSALFIFCLLSFFNCMAVTEKIPSGSFIINLGVVPQTIANGLKPYGLVYDMLQNFHVPVKWVINPQKQKDGIDFSYNGTDYRSGAFIILAQYRTGGVNTAITGWQTKGVIGVTTTSEISLEVYSTITYAPRWTIDKENGSLVVPFFENAGIPASAHGGSSQSSWKNPADLNICDDIFALPHADPAFQTHKNLLDWNRDFKGAIWSGCHAVSVLENIGLNFLTTGGLLDYINHTNGSTPYTYTYPSDPIMQFIGDQDDASRSGSESIYLPKAGSSWRNGVRIYIYDPDHPQVPSLSPGPAVVMAYGRGFDDSSRGLVMYQGGHFHNGSDRIVGGGNTLSGTPFNADHVALQRSFFNFSFLAVISRHPEAVNASIITEPEMRGGETYPVNFTLPPDVSLNDYSITWSVSSGTIETSDAGDVTFTPPNDPDVKLVLLTLILRDACGRQYFSTYNINVTCIGTPFDPGISVPPIVDNNKFFTAEAIIPDSLKDEAFAYHWDISEGVIDGPADGTSLRVFPPYDIDVDSILIRLTVTDKCKDAFVTVKTVRLNDVIKNHGLISVAKLVSANNDGMGYDFLHIENIELYPENELTIYNRWGNVIYQEKKYDNYAVIFNGQSKTSSSEELVNGVYYYLLNLNKSDRANRNPLIKGFFILKR